MTEYVWGTCVDLSPGYIYDCWSLTEVGRGLRRSPSTGGVDGMSSLCLSRVLGVGVIFVVCMDRSAGLQPGEFQISTQEHVLCLVLV